ncbi:MAG: hypothetical protein KGY44_08705 [Halanaerobiales bacterium]|nr:hypothetical protein [Halanaerobiales bacterium]
MQRRVRNSYFITSGNDKRIINNLFEIIKKLYTVYQKDYSLESLKNIIRFLIQFNLITINELDKTSQYRKEQFQIIFKCKEILDKK